MKIARPDPALLLAVTLFFALLALALFGERLAPNEDIYFVVEHGKDQRPYGPGVVFPLGSDVLGRDLFSLVLAGARTTLMIVLLAGLARVAAGVLIAALGRRWWPTRLLTDSLAQLVAAVPATIVALVLVKIFVNGEAGLLIFVGALLLIGWAGPYRIVRTELDRVAHAPFTEGARAMGAGPWRLFWRHQLPHLVPVIATNLSQQIVASLVLVAELGVLGVLVGTTRIIDLSESRTFFYIVQNIALVADAPEWGGLLANSRTIEALWVSRFLILLPGVAFAFSAVAIAAIGFALARRYARRDLIDDLRGRGAAALGLAVVALIVVSGLVPERYAEARGWASTARSEVRSTTDVRAAFEDAGLETTSVSREVTSLNRTGPASVSVGQAKVTEEWPIPPEPPLNTLRIRSVVSAKAGGAGVVEAPLVYAARGIVPSRHPPPPRTFGMPAGRDFSEYIQDYPDDYAGIDVRGKIVLLVRFMGITLYPPGADRQSVRPGPLFEEVIADAIERGAAAVVFVDPALPYYTETISPFSTGRGLIRGGPNPYTRLEREAPATTPEGTPVLVLDAGAAHELLGPLGVDLSPLLNYDLRGTTWARSSSRNLSVTARVEVRVAHESASVTSHVGAVQGVPEDAGWVVVWAPRRAAEPGPRDVLASLGRTLNSRRVPFVFVDFDPAVDPQESVREIARSLRGKRIALVVVLDGTRGQSLTFTTPYGELIPALDLYAEKASVRFEPTRETARRDALDGFAPFIDAKTVVVRGASGEGDLRGDVTAFLGYLAGRLALGAPELPR